MFKLIASVLGIGYVKGGGTVAAATCLVLYLARAGGPTVQPWPAGLLTAGLLTAAAAPPNSASASTLKPTLLTALRTKSGKIF